jgi:hypothetical protein
MIQAFGLLLRVPKRPGKSRAKPEKPGTVPGGNFVVSGSLNMTTRFERVRRFATELHAWLRTPELTALHLITTIDPCQRHTNSLLSRSRACSTDRLGAPNPRRLQPCFYDLMFRRGDSYFVPFDVLALEGRDPRERRLGAPGPRRREGSIDKIPASCTVAWRDPGGRKRREVLPEEGGPS